MLILGIDPGPTQSAVVQYSAGKVCFSGIFPNEKLLNDLRMKFYGGEPFCEMIACYGMAVGKEVFETVLWIGRFMEAKGGLNLVYRRDIKLYLCNSMKAKDANVAQALRDLHGPVGTKKTPGPLYGIKSHLWAALAVATYGEHLLNEKKAA